MPMIVIICGSRGFTDYEFVKKRLDAYFSNNKPDEIIHGDCEDSPDKLAERYAKENGIKCTAYPADWKTHGKAAGPIRNTLMSTIGTHCIAFSGGTRGTNDMINKSAKKGLALRVVEITCIK